MSNHTGNNGNRKEEILEKSRKAKHDEGIEYVKNSGSVLGRYVALFVVIIPISIISAWTGHMYVVWALAAVSASFQFGDAIASYRFTKSKSDILKVAAAGVFSILFAYWFLQGLLGW